MNKKLQEKLNQSLSAACHKGDLDEVKEIIKQGADIQSFDNKAILSAGYSNRLEIVKYLHEQGADIGARNNDLIGDSIKMGNPEILKYCIDNMKNIDISKMPEYLQTATDRGDLENVKLLVENGADVNTDDGEAIINASRYGHLDVVKFFIENGADVNAEDEKPIKNAANNGHIEIVKLLHQNGADLSKAIRSASDDIKDELKSYKTSIEEKALLETDLQSIKPQAVAPSRRI